MGFDAINDTKPLVYLDQNILDLILKKISSDTEFYLSLRDNLQVVYSDITLDEIHRSAVGGGDFKYAESFLNLLCSLNAHYICLCQDENQMLTNSIFRSNKTPFQHYEQYLENLNIVQYSKSMKDNLFGVYGGITDFEELKKVQIENLSQLISIIEAQISILESNSYRDTVVERFIVESKDKIINLRQQEVECEFHINNMVDKLKEANRTKSAYIGFRESLNINVDKINNIEGPNLLRKIWREIQKLNNLQDMDLEDFFQIKKHSIFPEKTFYLFEKVNSIYTMLNLIGYKQDKGLNKKKRFEASFSDMSHASYACFCHFFLTNDKPFAQKTLVIYEYLGISTQLCSIEIE